MYTDLEQNDAGFRQYTNMLLGFDKYYVAETLQKKKKKTQIIYL